MPPVSRPFPRFIADYPQEGQPYGRWQERLTRELAAACEPLAAEAGAPLEPESVKWFPERTWADRVYVPATGRGAERSEGGETDDGEQASGPSPTEYFGWVSFERPD